MTLLHYWILTNETLWHQDTIRVPWTARRSNQSILKEINPEYSLVGLMLKLQYFGHLMGRANSLEKTDTGKDWRQEEKGTTEDEMVGWHHWLNGHEFEQTPGDGEGQGSLVCCRQWGHKELDMTEWLNWTEEVNITKKYSCRRLTRTYLWNPWRLRGKETTYKEGDLGLILELGRSPGGGHGNPLQYSFFFFFNFNWRLIILQYCGGFAI